VRIYQEWYAFAPVNEDGYCHGVVAYELISGGLIRILGKSGLFATGGYGRVYAYSTNALINTGSGIGIAYKAGIPVKDMEFVQFHPTGLIGTNILMTEACRGEGGYLINNKGERFMERYVPKAMELAPRDIVSRSIQTEIDEGRGFDHPLGKYIKLDLRHLGEQKIREKLPGIRQISIDFIGIDPILDPIPIMPSQHYSMGGIDTNERAETELPGFYAAGECACVSVHGANRLGGNSLLDTIVFGKLAASAISEFLQGQSREPKEKAVTAAMEKMERRILTITNGGKEKPYILLAELNRTMFSNVGIFRKKDEMERALSDVMMVKERYRQVGIFSSTRHMNYELMNALELEYMIEVAHTIALGALLREESRGAHFRRDFTTRDDNRWLKHTIARAGTDGQPEISYKPVVITRFQPMERTY